MKNAILSLSIITNLVLLGFLFLHMLEGSPEVTNGSLGVLTQDIEVGQFDGDEVLFTLPKGLLVKDASATGAGWFEPHRFKIIVTSNDENLVNYNGEYQPIVEQEYELYSAEVKISH